MGLPFGWPLSTSNSSTSSIPSTLPLFFRDPRRGAPRLQFSRSDVGIRNNLMEGIGRVSGEVYEMPLGNSLQRLQLLLTFTPGTPPTV